MGKERLEKMEGDLFIGDKIRLYHANGELVAYYFGTFSITESPSKTTLLAREIRKKNDGEIMGASGSFMHLENGLIKERNNTKRITHYQVLERFNQETWKIPYSMP